MFICLFDLVFDAVHINMSVTYVNSHFFHSAERHLSI